MAGASLVSGVAGYLVIAFGTRAVGEVLFAPVSVLWSLWSLSVAAISFPIQHWTIRSAEADGEHAVWAQVPRLGVLVAVLVAAVAASSLALGTRLFPSSSGAFTVMVALLPLGGFLVGLQRGVLTHRRRYGAVAAVIAGENLLRATATLAILALGAGGPTASVLLGWAIIGGFAITAFTPRALRPDARATRTASRASFRLLGGFAGANVAAQAALTSAPVVLALLAAPESVITQVFAILALLRVPYTGFVGASVAFTGPLARMVDAGRAPDIRRWELRAGAGVVVVAATAFLLAPRVLPPTVDLLFATDVTIGKTAQGLLAAGGVLAVAGLAEMLVLLALRRSRRLLVSWGAGLAAGGICLVLPIEPVTRVSVAFLVAELVAVTALTVRRSTPSAG